MAINPSDRWPGRTEAPDADYPYGGAKDETSPDAFDGTPFERPFINDMWGFYQALLSQAGITPSGNPDTAQASQYLEALEEVIAEGVAGFVNRQEATVTLGGNFGGGQVRVLREGNRVTIMGTSALTHDESSTPTSAQNAIPFWARPTTTVAISSTYSTGLTDGVSGDVLVTSNGAFRLHYRDPSGAPIPLDYSELAPSITYLRG